MTMPVYQIITPSDWQSYGNFEYRIPIIGQTVSLVPFFDAGVNRIMRPSQLTMDPQRVLDSISSFPRLVITARCRLRRARKCARLDGPGARCHSSVVNAPFRIYLRITRCG